MGDAQPSPAGSVAEEYVPPDTCEAFENASGIMCLRLGKDMLSWGLNKDIGSTTKNTRSWSWEGMDPVSKVLGADVRE